MCGLVDVPTRPPAGLIEGVASSGLTVDAKNTTPRAHLLVDVIATVL